MKLLLLLLTGCSHDTTTEAVIDTSYGSGETADTADSRPPDDALPPGSCTDPTYNPWLDTCAADFFAPCFQPTGTCEVEAGTSGFVTTWSNGTVLTIALGAGMPPTATLTLTAADGTVCATGEPASESVCPTTVEQVGTTFTRTSDGATRTWCVAMAERSTTVSCADGETAVSDGTLPGTVTCMFGGDQSCDLSSTMPPPP